MNLAGFTSSMLPEIESELQRQIARLNEPHTQPFYEMLTYHMGWTGDGAGAAATGKRIRPLLLLLTCAAAGGNWMDALPAAASVELVHNFSLIHDDIEDNSDKRRGRETVWVKWGLPHAVNAGDGLFALSGLAVSDLSAKYSAKVVVRTEQLLFTTLLDLTRGQFLDMAFENRGDLTVDDYWPMVSGKTAALLSACTGIGALLGGAKEADQVIYRDFGHSLGMAFQVLDDYLGIWGDPATTGKSIASDLAAGKKSLPVLYGLGKQGPFAQRWIKGPLNPDEIPQMADELASEGGKLYTLEMADQMTDLSLASLREVAPHGDAGGALFELVQMLLARQG
ncbi:MAG: polyprenyl synthetase family protein [Anaerolineales bacterium]